MASTGGWEGAGDCGCCATRANSAYLGVIGWRRGRSPICWPRRVTGPDAARMRFAPGAGAPQAGGDEALKPQEMAAMEDMIVWGADHDTSTAFDALAKAVNDRIQDSWEP